MDFLSSKKSRVWFVVILIIASIIPAYFIFKKDQVTQGVQVGENSKMPSVGQKQPQLNAVANSMTEDIQSNKPYVRQLPKRFVTPQVLLKISSLHLRDEEVIKMADQIINSSQEDVKGYSFDSKAKWDINEAPNNDAEYKLAMEELSVVALGKFVDAAMSKDIFQMRLAAGGYAAVQVIRNFQFTGLDKQGRPLLKIPHIDRVVSNLKNSKNGKRRFPATATTAPLYDFEKMVGGLTAQDKKILTKIRQEQTAYFEQTAGRTHRTLNYSKGDVIFDKVNVVMDAIVGAASNMVGLDKTPTDFHKTNQKLVIQVLKDIKKYPQSYGFTKKQVSTYNIDFKNGRMPAGNYITDVDFEIYVRQIIHNKSLKSATWGAGLSTLVSSALGTFISGIRFWGAAIITSMGIETFFMSVSSYQGLKQMHVLHRYYSHLMGSKIAAQQNSDVDWQDSADEKFDPEKIMFDENFQHALYRSWLVGVAMGGSVKTLLARPQVQFLYTKFLLKTTATQTAAKAVINPYIVPASMRYGASQTTVHTSTKYSAIVVAKAAAFMAQLMELPAMQFIARIMTRGWKITSAIFPFEAGKDFFRLFSKANIAVTAIDLALTWTFIYSGIYTNLYTSSQILNQTTLSPGANIQLALLQEIESVGNFQEASRRVLYPLCASLASHSKGKKDKLPTYQELKNRKRACRDLIMGLEGMNIDEFKLQFPALSKVVDPYSKTVTSKSEYSLLIQQAHTYPASYQVVWLSALRSIYPLNFVPELYWRTRMDMISGPGTFLNTPIYDKIFTLNRSIPATMLNLNRLNYAVEMIAQDKFAQAHDDILDKDDPKIADRIKSYEDAFLIYFKYHSMQTGKNIAQLKKMDKKLEDSTTASSITGALKGLFNQIAFAFDRFTSEPVEWTFKPATFDEIRLIKDPGSKPRKKKKIIPF